MLALLVIATGVTVRELNIPEVQQLTGAGIYYGATLTEAANFKDQPVFVIGGANSAGQGAMHFARYASKVTMLVRGSSLSKSMSHYLIEQIEANDKIEVLTETNCIEVHGDERLEAITIQKKNGTEGQKVEAAALFVFIGAMPHTEMLEGVIERNRAGFHPHRTGTYQGWQTPGWVGRSNAIPFSWKPVCPASLPLVTSAKAP